MKPTEEIIDLKLSKDGTYTHDKIAKEVRENVQANKAATKNDAKPPTLQFNSMSPKTNDFIGGFNDVSKLLFHIFKL